MVVKNFPKALEFYRKIMEFPEDFIRTKMPEYEVLPWLAQVHFNLSRVYYFLGDKVSGLRAAKKANDLDPITYSMEDMQVIDKYG